MQKAYHLVVVGNGSQQVTPPADEIFASSFYPIGPSAVIGGLKDLNSGLQLDKLNLTKIFSKIAIGELRIGELAQMKSVPTAIILLLLSAFIVRAQDPKPPNIVILYADDMGVGDVSYGDADAKIQTPNIDRLAKQGMTFSDGHSSSGICTPSRFALLTGQHHWRRFHGIVNAFGASVFEEGEFTIARMVKEQGYQTGCFGKWHLGWDWAAIRKPGVTKADRPKAASYDCCLLYTSPSPRD